MSMARKGAGPLAVAAATALAAFSAAADIEFPAWARDAGADYDAYTNWAARCYHPMGSDGAAARPTSLARLFAAGGEEDFSDQFLMDVDAYADVRMRIDAIEVSDEGSLITISATTNGVPMSLGAEVEVDEEEGVTWSKPALNGHLNVTVGRSLLDMVSIAVTDNYLTFRDGKALVTIPAKYGSFVKATIDYRPSDKGALGD